MKTGLKTIILLFVSINVFGQQEIKFQVEELSKPEKPLHSINKNEFLKSIILDEVDLAPYEVEQNNIDYPYHIIATSKLPDQLVIEKNQPFFNGMYRAYADHRPFVISPDMIWLLISQGFAHHVNANPELLRNKFVDFDGRQTLQVNAKDVTLNSPASDWENIFSEFTQQIGNHTGTDLIEILTADFSTTTPAEKVASEITIMEVMEPYFEFVVFYIVCGIPEITLKGTPDDWQKIYDRTKLLAAYDLKWWTDEMEPILKKIIKTSEGKVNKRFWRNMFKYHSQKEYGAPKIIDGWIVKFFPYDKDGKRNNLKQLEGGDNLPDEFVKVNLDYIETSGNETKTTPLELWAGFMGLEQNNDDFTLTPTIGWMIRKKDVTQIGLKQKLESDDNKSFSSGISIRVEEIPKALFDLKEINRLEIEFINGIKIPDRLSENKIGTLELKGEIDDAEAERIKKMFPNTIVRINESAQEKNERFTKNLMKHLRGQNQINE